MSGSWWPMAFLVLAPMLAAREAPRPALARLKALEQKSGGRLGVSALALSTGRSLDYRARERFPMCSTFKVILAGAVLARVDAGRAALDQKISFGVKDLLAYAPVTRARVDEGAMSLGDLCAASVQVSDNTAANLLLDFLGGPGAVTAFVRRLGDPVTRLDRKEPELNDVPPGDARDTTTPGAMRRTLQEILTGRILTPASRQRLGQWMAACTTGTHRLRAGLPPDWEVKDKTGSGPDGAGITNDIGVATPPGKPPIFMAVYLAGSKGDGPARESILAEAGRIIADALGQGRDIEGHP